MPMVEQTDEHFRYFYEAEDFGPAEFTQPASQALIERYRGKLPDQMLEYWRTWGFCSFGKGLFWTVNPDDYTAIVEQWLQGTGLLSKDNFYVIGRSAFGELFLWGTRSGQSLVIYPVLAMIFPRDQTAEITAGKGDFLAQTFFGGRKKTSLDKKDDQGSDLFDRAFQKLGQLGPEEMYGFVPALALGGRPTLSNLRKVTTIPHLSMLAQLGEPTFMRDIVKNAQGLGLMK